MHSNIVMFSPRLAHNLLAMIILEVREQHPAESRVVL